MRALDLHGMKFSRMTVACCAGPDSRGAIMWRCRCDCGNEKDVRGSDLKRGFIKSCGCLNSEATATRNATHRQSHTRLYRIWQAMHDRTANMKCDRYRYYGARGISVCVEWFEFAPFAQWALQNGYCDPLPTEPRSRHLTIDRRDVDGNYEPGNCRWVVQRVQVKNRRKK
jgi:hypothetical protein